MADSLNEKQLRENIAEILKGGDLATLTSKKIRQILEEKHGVDLKDRKKQIDDIVMSLIDEDSDNSEEGSSPNKQSKSSSEPERSPPKKKKVSVKSERDETGSHDSADDDSEDEKLKVSKRITNKRKAVKTPKERSKPSKKPAGDGKKKSGFAMPMALSPELAALMGETHMARSEVVKRMWQIIRERNLMDPANKRYTICDEELEKIIGQKRFLTFSMMKYLKKHVKDPSLMVQ